jgi:hypothetical protein
MEVAHIVANHSYEGERVKRNQEALVVHYCDFLGYDLIRQAAAATP